MTGSAASTGASAGPAAPGIIVGVAVFCGVQEGVGDGPAAAASSASVLAVESLPPVPTVLASLARVWFVALLSAALPVPAGGELVSPVPGSVDGAVDVELGVGVGVGVGVGDGVGDGLVLGDGLVVWLGVEVGGGEIVDGDEAGVELPGVPQFEPFAEPDDEPLDELWGDPDWLWGRPGPILDPLP